MFKGADEVSLALSSCHVRRRIHACQISLALSS
jgi:hypothetical protein